LTRMRDKFDFQPLGDVDNRGAAPEGDPAGSIGRVGHSAPRTALRS